MAKRKPIKKPRVSKKKPEAAPELPLRQYSTIEQAAVHCGVAVGTFRHYLSKYPDLPVHERNVSGSGYKIDLEELDKWRATHDLLNWTPKLLAGEGEGLQIKTKDRKSQIQTELLQIELDEKMGRLIPKEDVVKAFSTKIAQIAKRFDQIPAYVGRKAGLEPDAIELLRRYLDECRIALAQDNDGFFTAIGNESPVVHAQLLP